jgi:predicted nucleic acid-binding protein
VIVLDATVIIGTLNGADAHHDQSASLVRRNAAETFGVSPLTLAEVLVRPAREGRLELAQSALERLGVVSQPLGSDAPEHLAALRAATGLQLPDCCVLLAAQDVRGSVATFDERLAKAAAALGIPLAI